MFKSRRLLVFLLSIFVASSISVKAFARALTTIERKEYAQNNIIFYQPCDTEADCEQQPDVSTDTTDPDDPGTSDADPSPSGGGDKGDPFTPAGSGAALIASTARAMSWPTSAGTCRNSAGTYVGWLPTSIDKSAPCQNTMSDYLKSLGLNSLIQDCGKFVGTVMRRTVDPNYQASGVKWQIPYMNRSSKWVKVSTDGQLFSMANLKPGDVIAFSENGHGHTMIWLGEQTVPCARGRCQINVASSSFGTRSPSLNKITRMRQCTKSGECFIFQVFRWVGD